MIYGADSTAQVSIQAAEQVLKLGALPPFSVASPLLPLLVASVVGLTGSPTEWAYVGVVGFVYALGCAGVYLLVRRLRGTVETAATAALLYALAPSRLYTVFDQPDGARVLFWSLVPFLLLALEVGRRKPGAAALLFVGGSAILLLATFPGRPRPLDALAVAELVVVGLATLWPPFRSPRARWICFAVFLSCAAWTFLLLPRYSLQPAPMPQGALQWINQHSEGARVFGPVSIDVMGNPVLAQAAEFVHWGEHRTEFLLWLKTVGVQYVVTADWQRFHAYFECLYDEKGWCVYYVPSPNAAQAVVVSRSSRKTLRPIRGLFDRQGLEAYLDWAGRPEAVGLHWTAAGRGEIRADLGPSDMILLRVTARPEWRAAVLDGPDQWTDLPIQRDPLGYMVIEPDRTGPVTLRIEYRPSWWQRVFPPALPDQPLVAGEFPAIFRDAIVDGVEHTPPPFGPNAVLTVYGRNFVPRRTRVLFGEIAGEVLYVGPNQINVKLPPNLEPGLLPVRVDAEGRLSYPHMIEVSR